MLPRSPLNLSGPFPFPHFGLAFFSNQDRSSFSRFVGVLLGATMSTLGSRTTTFGLADLRGGLHVGFMQRASPDAPGSRLSSDVVNFTAKRMPSPHR